MKSYKLLYRKALRFLQVFEESPDWDLLSKFRHGWNLHISVFK